MTNATTIVLAIGVVMATLGPDASWAQQAPAQTAPAEQNLAKQPANPISSLVSLPFQFNWEQNVGPNDQTRFVLNVQRRANHAASRV
jgi:hypothetical protein